MFLTSFFHFDRQSVEDDEDEEAAENDSMDVDEAEQEEELPKLTPAEAYIKRQSEIADAKKNIASICTNLLSSPEDSVSSKGIHYSTTLIITLTTLLLPKGSVRLASFMFDSFNCIFSRLFTSTII